MFKYDTWLNLLRSYISYSLLLKISLNIYSPPRLISISPDSSANLNLDKNLGFGLIKMFPHLIHVYYWPMLSSTFFLQVSIGQER